MDYFLKAGYQLAVAFDRASIRFLLLCRNAAVSEITFLANRTTSLSDDESRSSTAAAVIRPDLIIRSAPGLRIAY